MYQDSLDLQRCNKTADKRKQISDRISNNLLKEHFTKKPYKHHNRRKSAVKY